MVENGPKWSKWSKIVKMVNKNGGKIHSQNGLKMLEMVKNGGPDLKQARPTGLSARRARRTKSSGLHL